MTRLCVPKCCLNQNFVCRLAATKAWAPLLPVLTAILTMSHVRFLLIRQYKCAHWQRNSGAIAARYSTFETESPCIGQESTCACQGANSEFVSCNCTVSGWNDMLWHARAIWTTPGSGNLWKGSFCRSLEAGLNMVRLPSSFVWQEWGTVSQSRWDRPQP